jgi:hypothetical protein
MRTSIGCRPGHAIDDDAVAVSASVGAGLPAVAARVPTSQESRLTIGSGDAK